MTIGSNTSFSDDIRICPERRVVTSLSHDQSPQEPNETRGREKARSQVLPYKTLVSRDAVLHPKTESASIPRTKKKMKENLSWQEDLVGNVWRKTYTFTDVLFFLLALGIW